MAEAERDFDGAVALTLVSGVFMAWAGYLLADGDTSAALWVTLPPVLTIELGFALLRRADRRAARPRLTTGARVRQETVIFLAGGLMMLAGYTAAWSWIGVLPLILVGGIVAGNGLIADDLARKQRLVRDAEKYIANPPTKAALLLGVPLPLVLLETTGRRTGKPRRMPVVNGIIDDTLWIVAEHGRHARYVQNLLADPHVRVKRGRHWRDGTATVLGDDDPIARAMWIAHHRHQPTPLVRLANRMFCTNPVTVRVNLEPATPRAIRSTPNTTTHPHP